MNLPQARTTNVVVQDLGKELLVYDLLTNHAFNLNETSKIVFNACDGKTSFDELKRKHHFTDDLIFFAIDELKKADLIESEVKNHFIGLSRREVIRKVGLASLIALPLISALVAPSAANAASSRCPQGSPNRTGAPAGTVVMTQITNQSNDTMTNQTAAGANLRAECCSNVYGNFISNGCSAGVGETCFAQATCS